MTYSQSMCQSTAMHIKSRVFFFPLARWTWTNFSNLFDVTAGANILYCNLLAHVKDNNNTINCTLAKDEPPILENKMWYVLPQGKF